MIKRILSCEDLIDNPSVDNSIEVVSELLGEEPYTRDLPFYLDTNHLDANYNNALQDIFSQTVSSTDKIHLFRLKSGIVFGQGTVVTDNGTLIRNSAAEYINHGLAPDGSTCSGELYSIDNLHNLDLVIGTSVLVKRPWYLNYGHWLVDLMPILPLVKEVIPEVDNIIFGNVPPGSVRTMMEETASLFYPAARKIFAADTDVLQCEELYYVRPVHVPPLFKHPSAISKTIMTAKSLYSCENASNRKKIYISRNRSGARRISNENELISYISEIGFETVYPELMSIPDQISLFEHAEIVIGVKGAALTNAIFCQKHCHVILLSPSKFVDPFFWDIIAQRGIKYSEIYCKDVPNSASENLSHTDLQIDIASIKTLLQKI